MQLDRPERGFSYATDAPLDMRMDQRRAPDRRRHPQHLRREADLARVLHEFGEERFAGRIAAYVVRRRASARRSRTTGELVELLYQAIPAATRRTGGHPAKRTFQALRIAVNAELESLRPRDPGGAAGAALGGRIVVMAYQSLEDRIVKTRVRARRRRRALPPACPSNCPATGRSSSR